MTENNQTPRDNSACNKPNENTEILYSFIPEEEDTKTYCYTCLKKLSKMEYDRSKLDGFPNKLCDKCFEEYYIRAHNGEEQQINEEYYNIPERECDVCHSVDVPLKDYPGDFDQTPIYLCEICDYSIEYPLEVVDNGLEPTNREIIKAIAYSANLILKGIKNGNE